MIIRMIIMILILCLKGVYTFMTHMNIVSYCTMKENDNNRVCFSQCEEIEEASQE